MNHTNRRRFLGSSATLAGSCILRSSVLRADEFRSPNNRPRLGVVGCGSRWGWQLATGGSYGVGPDFAAFGDYVAVCDVDHDRRTAAAGLVKQWNGAAPSILSDYRELLSRDDLDAVLVFTPDHWHTKVAIEAMLSGKDVYCEKPMTLTIEEGQQICKVADQTRRVVQVGTQQRSNRRFITAIALIRAGRLGELTRVECGIGGAPTSQPLPSVTPPKSLDWDMWLGPAPEVDYRFLSGANNETKAWSNCHYEFRWWYEYSGGKLTDWGAHHVDIATWGMDKTETGPVSIEPELIEHPVKFRDGNPVQKDRYNTATKFRFKARYDDAVELTIRHDARNGVLFEGTQGRIFVNRGKIEGKPVKQLVANPLPDGALEEVYGGPLLDQTERFDSKAHVQNFFESVQSRSEPISDAGSHHRALTTCHLANIAGRLGRTIKWDPARESVIGDSQAQAMTRREQRQGYEIEV